jgi:hypothetical protein
MTSLVVRIMRSVLPFCGGRVGTRHPKLDTIRKEEGVSGGVVKLTSIVALDTPDGTTKLRGHISEKVRAWGTCQNLE